MGMRTMRIRTMRIRTMRIRTTRMRTMRIRTTRMRTMRMRTMRMRTIGMRVMRIMAMRRMGSSRDFCLMTPVLYITRVNALRFSISAVSCDELKIRHHYHETIRQSQSTCSIPKHTR